MLRAGDKKEVTIDGKDFQLEVPPTSWVLDLIDDVTEGRYKTKELVNIYLENIVVKPTGLKVDDLSIEGVIELKDEIEGFLNPKSKKNKKQLPKL